MFINILVHPRVRQKRPDVTDEDVIHAWRNAIVVAGRVSDHPDYYIAAGMDTKGRMLELVGVELENDTFMIFHAMKLTTKMINELGL